MPLTAHYSLSASALNYARADFYRRCLHLCQCAPFPQSAEVSRLLSSSYSNLTSGTRPCDERGAVPRHLQDGEVGFLPSEELGLELEKEGYCLRGLPRSPPAPTVMVHDLAPGTCLLPCPSSCCPGELIKGQHLSCPCFRCWHLLEPARLIHVANIHRGKGCLIYS